MPVAPSSPSKAGSSVVGSQMEDENGLGRMPSICHKGSNLNGIDATSKESKDAMDITEFDTPPRQFQKGSPADEFLTSSCHVVTPTSLPTTSAELTCNLSLIPKDGYSKRRRLSAICVNVHPILRKGDTVRRKVYLRDSFGECFICVWGNHTHMFDDDIVGRAVTFNRICLQEYEGELQVSMPKDSSIVIGKNADNASVVTWFQNIGETAITVPAAQALEIPGVICISGILAKSVTETITLRSGLVRQLTTIYLAYGPPNAHIKIKFWNSQTDSRWEVIVICKPQFRRR